MIGFFVFPIFIMSYELATEQTQEDGVSDTMSCGLINLFNQVFAFVICISLTPALKAETHKSTAINFMVIFLILLLSLFSLILGSIFGRVKRAKRKGSKALIATE